MNNISSASSHAPTRLTSDPLHQEPDDSPRDTRTVTSGVPERELPRRVRRRTDQETTATSGPFARAGSRSDPLLTRAQRVRIALLIAELQAWVTTGPSNETRVREETARQIGKAFANGSESLCLRASGRASAQRLSTLPDCLGDLSSLKQLDISNHAITTLPRLPPSLTRLDVGGNHLQTLPPALQQMEHLQVLRAPGNLLRAIPALPDTLAELDLSMNRITGLGTLPAGVKSLWMSKNLVVEALVLPAGLISLDLSENRLVSLVEMPASLQYLDVAGNFLTALPELPEGMHCICASKNQLRSLPAIPDSLRILDVMNNQLRQLPQLSGTFASISLDGNQLTELPEHFESITPSQSGLAINVSSNPWSAACIQRLGALETRFGIVHLDAAQLPFQFLHSDGVSPAPGLPFTNRTPPFDYDNQEWSVIAAALQDHPPVEMTAHDLL